MQGGRSCALWPNKVFFRPKTGFLGQEVHYYMVYIAYYAEVNLQTCDTDCMFIRFSIHNRFIPNTL